jgi:hypothetical protein
MTVFGLAGCDSNTTIASDNLIVTSPEPVPTTTADCSTLAVYIEHPYPGESSEDYSREAVTITGYVNLPQASVAVNGVEAEVSPDGTYTATIQLKEGSNSIQAIAVLGEMTDEITYAVGVDEKGRMYAIPGLGGGGPRYQSRVNYENSLELQSGETVSTILVLDVRKDIREKETFTYTIKYVAGEYSDDVLQLPEGMEVTIEPSQFDVCPNEIYDSALTISTTEGVYPGDYWFRLEQNLKNGYQGTGWIKIIVTS